jgi:GT2 family glycosyltransferase/ubiquinone/menaquinone biosynthesis C-methylase UbiE
MQQRTESLRSVMRFIRREYMPYTSSRIVATLPSANVPEAFTGERYIPSIDGEIAWEHLHRYALALHAAEGKVVLDIASGEGYGSYLLSQVAQSVIGVDIDATVVATAQSRYGSERVSFRHGRCQEIPCDDSSVDLVVSFETLEHISEHDTFFKEIRRVLRPGGSVLISSPERVYYNLERDGFKNTYHELELTLEEFEQLVTRYFAHHTLARQGTLFSSLIIPRGAASAEPLFYAQSEGKLVQQQELLRAPYIIALCSDQASSINLPLSVFDPGLPSTVLSALRGGIAERDNRLVVLREELRALEQEATIVKNACSAVTVKHHADLKAFESRIKEADHDIHAAQLSAQRADERCAEMRKELEKFQQMRDAEHDLYARLMHEIRKVEAPQQVPLPRQERDILGEVSPPVVEQVIALPVVTPKRTLRSLITSSRAARMKAIEEAHAEQQIQRETQELQESGLFDPTFYTKRYPDIQAAQIDPLRHYLTLGWREGRDPHPLFSSNYYRARYSDVAQLDICPLLHFVRHGMREKRDPHVLFRTESYESLLLSHGINIVETPFKQYLSTDASWNYSPHPLFDAPFYRSMCGDAIAQDKPLLVQYLESVGTVAPSPLIDPQFYRKHNHDFCESGMTALEHYVLIGAHERRYPSPYFDPHIYLRESPHLSPVRDLAEHMVLHGSREGHFALPHFDVDFYKSWCPEAFSSDEGPYLYYLREFVHGASIPLCSKRIASMLLRIEKARSEAVTCAQSASGLPQVSIVIPVYNQLGYTLRCIASIIESKPKYRYEIIIVDDCSSDRTEEVLSVLPYLTYVRQEKNGGFISSCNLGASHARAPYLVFLNNDTHVLPGWLDELYDTALRDDTVGLVGSKLIYPDGILQEAGGILWKDGAAWNYGRNQPRDRLEYSYARRVDYCSGASLLIKRALFNECGGFDTFYAPAYAEDADLACKVRSKNLNVIYQPHSQIVHFEGISSGRDTASGVKSYQVENLKKLAVRWRELLSTHREGGVMPELEAYRTSKGRIFFLDACTPTPDKDAGSIVAYSWLSVLVSLGYHVTFLAQHNFLFLPGYTEQLQRIGVHVLYRPQVDSLESYLQTWAWSYDAVVALRHAVANPVYGLFAKYNQKIKKVFLPIDLHYVREEREASLTQSPDIRRVAVATRFEELAMVAKSDITCVHSSFERDELVRQIPSADVRVSPIILDVVGCVQPYQKRKDILFIGGYQHVPNVDAVFFFVQQVMPLLRERLPGVKFKVAGSNPPADILALNGDDVEILGFVKELTPLLESIRLTVAPLRFGAGVKGKVGVSMSHGVPVVGTPIAVEGMGLNEREGVLIGSTPEEIADRVVDLYTNASLWNELSERGMKRVDESFSMKANKREIAACFETLGL